MCSAHNSPRRGQIVGTRSNLRAGTWVARATARPAPMQPQKAHQRRSTFRQQRLTNWHGAEYNGDAGHFGTLGPRGWNCFVTIGSNGWTLYIAPEPLDSAKLLEHRNWKGFTGPAIQLSGSDGGTSGRFEVAKVVARVFPAHRDYARSIIAEGFGPAADYPFGPFPSDHLTYKGKNLVEFTTPAHRNGLGTMSWLLPSDQPITGIALLTIGPLGRHGTPTLESPASALCFISSLCRSSNKPKQMPRANPSENGRHCTSGSPRSTRPRVSCRHHSRKTGLWST